MEFEFILVTLYCAMVQALCLISGEARGMKAKITRINMKNCDSHPSAELPTVALSTWLPGGLRTGLRNGRTWSVDLGTT